ncbi:hypothetical protein AB0B94_30330 [Micromonospora sp. NPDC048986]|uniref:hypothetical protein n=1 Tax=Micromonospora sp. NPDC048986 TaxID=3155644 RepID=UPI0033CFE81F
MPRYSLDDPALLVALRAEAKEGAASWPAPDEEQLANLARLLAPPKVARTAPVRATGTVVEPRRAA